MLINKKACQLYLKEITSRRIKSDLWIRIERAVKETLDQFKEKTLKSETKKCKICGKEFDPIKTGLNDYCSDGCLLNLRANVQWKLDHGLYVSDRIKRFLKEN